MRKKLLAAFFLSFCLLAGCAAPLTLPAALPLLVSGAGGGISYTITNIVYKTFSHPIGNVKEANLKALEKMAMEVKGAKPDEKKVSIDAETNGLTIFITLEAITPKATRIIVNAQRNIFFKDKPTAYEIIVQTERYLEGYYAQNGQLKFYCPLSEAQE